MFSLAPLLVLVIAITGAVFGREAVTGQIVAQLSGLIGDQAAELVQGLVKSASEPGKGLIAGTISVVLLIVGATTVVAELQSALDRIWHVPEKDKPSGIMGVLRARLLSFGLIFGLGFLLMVSLSISAGVSAFGSWTGGLLPGQEVLLQALNALVSLGITTVLFAIIFKFMPTADVQWHDVWVGAAFTAVLFEVGKFLIGLYLGKAGINETFAAAGSLVILLAWVYYAAQILLLGAEFTKVYADEQGSLAGAKAMKSTAAASSENVAPQPELAGLQGASSALADSTSVQLLVARQLDNADRDVALAKSALAKQLLLLGALTLARSMAKKWQRQQHRSWRGSWLR